jgi:hypothetical protein
MIPRMRWEIEEYYKVVKGDYLGQGQFHSESVAGVEQELQALALFVASSRVEVVNAAPDHVLPSIEADVLAGVLVTIEDSRVRSRRLPVFLIAAFPGR